MGNYTQGRARDRMISHVLLTTYLSTYVPFWSEVCIYLSWINRVKGAAISVTNITITTTLLSYMRHAYSRRVNVQPLILVWPVVHQIILGRTHSHTDAHHTNSITAIRNHIDLFRSSLLAISFPPYQPSRDETGSAAVIPLLTDLIQCRCT
ncbi:hypothetical protein F4810DRAFT_286046 [Camillea tinctor]|nr:hypothetical protein F4810DRAFT_286046 [Camillea tinctor]